MTARILHFPVRNPQATSPLRPHGRSGLARRLLDRLTEGGRLQLERRYLAEMDDRTLRDIGVTRADVASELRRSIGWTGLLSLRG